MFPPPFYPVLSSGGILNPNGGFETASNFLLELAYIGISVLLSFKPLEAEHRSFLKPLSGGCPTWRWECLFSWKGRDRTRHSWKGWSTWREIKDPSLFFPAAHAPRLSEAEIIDSTRVLIPLRRDTLRLDEEPFIFYAKFRGSGVFLHFLPIRL